MLRKPEFWAIEFLNAWVRSFSLRGERIPSDVPSMNFEMPHLSVLCLQVLRNVFTGFKERVYTHNAGRSVITTEEVSIIASFRISLVFWNFVTSFSCRIFGVNPQFGHMCKSIWKTCNTDLNLCYYLPIIYQIINVCFFWIWPSVCSLTNTASKTKKTETCTIQRATFCMGEIISMLPSVNSHIEYTCLKPKFSLNLLVFRLLRKQE